MAMVLTRGAKARSKQLHNMPAKARSKRLDKMPLVVLEVIIAYLPFKSKLSLRLTCKRLAAEVTRKVGFHPVLTDDCVDSILDIKEQIRHSLAGFRIRNLTKLNFFPNALPEFATKITKLSILNAQYTKDTISSYNLYRLFHMFSNVTQLVLTGNILSEGIGINLQEFGGIKLDHLVVLKLSFTECRAKFHGLPAIELAKFPKLKKLDIFVDEEHYRLNWEDYDSLFFLIGSHGSSLKHLKFNDQALPEWPPGRYNVPVDRMQETISRLNNVQLESLEISIPLIQTSRAEKLVYIESLIRQQSTLKVISVDFPDQFPSFRDVLLEAIRKSSNTLESITYKHYTLDRIFYVDMSHFPCPNLKKFSMTTSAPVLNLHLIPNSIEYLVWDSPISMDDVAVLRLHLPNLIEIEFGQLAGYQSHEIFKAIFENPKTKRIIGCNQQSLGLPFVINRDFIQFPI